MPDELARCRSAQPESDVRKRFSPGRKQMSDPDGNWIDITDDDMKNQPRKEWSMSGDLMVRVRTIRHGRQLALRYIEAGAVLFLHGVGLSATCSS